MDPRSVSGRAAGLNLLCAAIGTFLLLVLMFVVAGGQVFLRGKVRPQDPVPCCQPDAPCKCGPSCPCYPVPVMPRAEKGK